jgi:hypothetical protein
VGVNGSDHFVDSNGFACDVKTWEVPGRQIDFPRTNLAVCGASDRVRADVLWREMLGIDQHNAALDTKLLEEQHDPSTNGTKTHEHEVERQAAWQVRRANQVVSQRCRAKPKVTVEKAALEAHPGNVLEDLGSSEACGEHCADGVAWPARPDDGRLRAGDVSTEPFGHDAKGGSWRDRPDMDPDCSVREAQCTSDDFELSVWVNSGHPLLEVHDERVRQAVGNEDQLA